MTSSMAGSVPTVPLSPQGSAQGAPAGEAPAAGKPVTPPLSSSPDAIACYQAALVAAAGGYPGVMGGNGGRSSSPLSAADTLAGRSSQDGFTDAAQGI